MSEVIKEAGDYREGADFVNHKKAISEGVQGLGWVAMVSLLHLIFMLGLTLYFILFSQQGHILMSIHSSKEQSFGLIKFVFNTVERKFRFFFFWNNQSSSQKCVENKARMNLVHGQFYRIYPNPPLKAFLSLILDFFFF